MGNGASSAACSTTQPHLQSPQLPQQIVVDGETLELSRVRSLIPELRADVRRQRDLLARYETERVEHQTALRERDDEVGRLRAEVDKLKSVLAQTAHKERPDLLSTIDEGATVGGPDAGRNKKQGVSGESSDKQARQAVHIELRRIQKEF
ncbi:PREDICTED: uncharacterized protein LOC106818972, partial [Priapulus caudatus]|uniref:Uncharacterized protein LOC106818972 n=1 Tax=Priapulus caudatus TaxID=37621 RepID=A0ABM1F3V2_PRICU